MNTTNYVYQIFDMSGDTVIVNMVNVDNDNAQITFGEPVSGTAVVVADADNYGTQMIDMGTM